MKKDGFFWFSKLAVADKYRGLRGEKLLNPKLQQLEELISQMKIHSSYNLPRFLPRHNFCQLDSGEIVQYTEMTSDDAECYCNYSDTILLGHGVIHHSEPMSNC